MVAATSSNLPLALAFSLLYIFATLSSALPTFRPVTGATSYEPLFLRVAPQVGPARSLERLRLRRRKIDLASSGGEGEGRLEKKLVDVELESLLVGRSYAIVVNPKLAARSFITSPFAVMNPKSKRSLSEVAIVTNPKSKRSIAAPIAVSNPKTQFSSVVRKSPKPRRNILTFISNIVNRRRAFPQERKRSAVTKVTNPKLGLTRRALTSIVIGIINVVPNPKFAYYSLGDLPSSSSSSPTSSSLSSAKTSTRISSTLTSTSTSTKISSSLTTSKPTSKVTTTTKAATTTHTTTSSAKPSATASTWPSGNMISGAYYPDWDGDLVPPSTLDYSLFDLLNYAFALPTSSGGVSLGSGSLLTELVKYAHGNNTKVVISIGGWTDSTYFSSAVATSASRKKFVAAILEMVTEYNVDGVDIDWEYPGGGGVDSNESSSSDTANFLLFLQALRTALGSGKRISACTTQTPFLGADGSPLTDVSAFAAVLDNVMVMNYDVWGASSTPGPNAPLSDACPDSNQPTANELSAIEIWTAAGFPASKILMGVPSYGYISSSSATTLVHRRSLDLPTNINNRERARMVHTENHKGEGRRWRDRGVARSNKRKEAEKLARREASVLEELQKRGTIIVCPNNHSGQPCAGITNQTVGTIDWNPLNTTTLGNGTVTTNSTGGVFNGGGIGKLGNGNLATIDGNQIQFFQLISYGVLVQDGTTSNFTAVNGYVSKWDTCSQTPYLYNTARKVVITYDDPQSMVLKAQLAKSQKIAGVLMWDISGDTYDWQLVKAYRSGMGLST